MHDMLSFVGQNVSRMMCGEACLADGCGTRSVLPRPCLDRPCSGTDSSVQASFWQLQVLEFEGSLARKLRFTSSTVWNLKEVSHKSFNFKSSTVGICKEVSHGSFGFTSSTVGV